MPFALYSLALAVFVLSTSEFVLAGLVPAISSDFAVASGTAGLLGSAFAVGMVVGAPIMAVLARRRPARLALLTCLLVFAGCHVAGALTSAFGVLFGLRVVSAVANAGFLAVALGVATRLAPAHRTGRAVSILLSGTTIATVVGAPAGSLIGATLGWRATFLGIAILCVPAAFGVCLGLRSRFVDPTGDVVRPALAVEIRQLGTRRLAVAMTLAALVNGGTFSVMVLLAPVVTGAAHLSEGWVSVALAMFGVGSFVGVTVAGRLSDRRPGRVLAVGCPLLVTGWVGLAVFASSPVVMLTLVLVQGAVAFGVGGTLITLVLNAAADAPTMGGSYGTVALNVGAAGGPALGAIGAGSALGTVAPIWVAVALTATAGGFALASRPASEDRVSGAGAAAP